MVLSEMNVSSLRSASLEAVENGVLASPRAGCALTATPRLLLRAPRTADLASLLSLHADPAVGRFCACTTPHGREATQAQLQSWLAHWRTEGFGPWAISELSQPDQIIGFGGVMRRSVSGHRGVYLYYRFAPQVWGRGLAAEMGQRALALAFDDLHERAVLASVEPANMPTRKTLEHLGLRLMGALADVPGQAASLLYELSAGHWASQPRAEPQAIAFAA